MAASKTVVIQARAATTRTAKAIKAKNVRVGKRARTHRVNAPKSF